MDAFYFSNLHWRFPKCLTALWLLSFFTFFFTEQGWGQGQLSLTPALQPQENTTLQPQEIKWVSGPGKTSLGVFADLQIPNNCRFTDAEGARSLLKRMKNPIPTGLIGIITPNSGEWMAVLEFNEIGYVKDANKASMNSKDILKAIQDRSEAQNKDHAKEGAAAIASVNWEREPVYDEKDHSLEWAIRVETHSGKVINHAFVLLGRQGVLDATMIGAYQGSSNLFFLKQLTKNIGFKDGQAYADYQKGDKIATIGLAELVVNDENPAASKDLTASLGAKNLAWIYYFLGGGAVMVGGLFFFRKLSMQKKQRAVYKNGHHSSAAVQALSKNGSGFNGVKLNGSNGHNGHRKRVCDFHKFYTSMILELSSPSYAGGYLTQNGNSDVRTPKSSSPLPSEPASDRSIVSANLELIAIQKNLIEEQRRLMLQQSKLIEDKNQLIGEKNQLIEEQNQFLERQSEMIENQYSLKLT
ncbi:MAG: DUF2167 domain-containing protein [Verrucomicrobiales bacterium]|nr:DUF2167 domain-containing protein [Verrucomicrobiales bacterium]